jgi:hypothetical protein
MSDLANVRFAPKAARPSERPHLRESAEHSARCSQLKLLGDGERIVNFDAEVTNRALKLTVAKQ